MEEPKGWRVKREVSLGDIVAIVLAFAAATVAWANLNTRVSLLEQATITQKSNDERQDAEAIRYQQRIGEELEKLNRKLDRLLERGTR